MCRQIAAGRLRMHPRTEMLDVVVIDGRARGVVRGSQARTLKRRRCGPRPLPEVTSQARRSTSSCARAAPNRNHWTDGAEVFLLC
jgi:hypothetical protein